MTALRGQNGESKFYLRKAPINNRCSAWTRLGAIRVGAIQIGTLYGLRHQKKHRVR